MIRWPGQGRSPRVEVVAGGRGEGDGLEQLAGPVALALQETKGADGQQMEGNSDAKWVWINTY